MRKFDFVIMNPPYAGSGKPLFMEIAKVFYENCLSDAGRLVSINPTSVIDNAFGGLDSHSKNLQKNATTIYKFRQFFFLPIFKTPRP